jgi:hypothetical protein
MFPPMSSKLRSTNSHTEPPMPDLNLDELERLIGKKSETFFKI